MAASVRCVGWRRAGESRTARLKGAGRGCRPVWTSEGQEGPRRPRVGPQMDGGCARAPWPRRAPSPARGSRKGIVSVRYPAGVPPRARPVASCEIACMPRGVSQRLGRLGLPTCAGWGPRWTRWSGPASTALGPCCSSTAARYTMAMSWLCRSDALAMHWLYPSYALLAMAWLCPAYAI